MCAQIYEKAHIDIIIGHQATAKEGLSDGHTHSWRLFVRPLSNQSLYFLDKVVFWLHPSFPQPKVTVKKPPFEVSKTGYAGFNLKVEFYFKNDGEPKKILHEDYDLFLHLAAHPPVNHTIQKSLVFINPTERFKKLLLISGAHIERTGSIKKLKKEQYKDSVSKIPRNEADASRQVRYPPQVKSGKESKKLPPSSIKIATKTEMNNKQKFVQQISNTKVAPIKNEKKVKANRPKLQPMDLFPLEDDIKAKKNKKSHKNEEVKKKEQKKEKISTPNRLSSKKKDSSLPFRSSSALSNSSSLSEKNRKEEKVKKKRDVVYDENKTLNKKMRSKMLPGRHETPVKEQEPIASIKVKKLKAESLSGHDTFSRIESHTGGADDLKKRSKKKKKSSLPENKIAIASNSPISPLKNDLSKSQKKNKQQHSMYSGSKKSMLIPTKPFYPHKPTKITTEDGLSCSDESEDQLPHPTEDMKKSWTSRLDKPTDESSLFRPDPSVARTVPNKPIKRPNPNKYSNSFKNKTTKKKSRQVASYSSSSSSSSEEESSIEAIKPVSTPSNPDFEEDGSSQSLESPSGGDNHLSQNLDSSHSSASNEEDYEQRVESPIDDLSCDVDSSSSSSLNTRDQEAFGADSFESSVRSDASGLSLESSSSSEDEEIEACRECGGLDCIRHKIKISVEPKLQRYNLSKRCYKELKKMTVEIAKLKDRRKVDKLMEIAKNHADLYASPYKSDSESYFDLCKVDSTGIEKIKKLIEWKK